MCHYSSRGIHAGIILPGEYRAGIIIPGEYSAGIILPGGNSAGIILPGEYSAALFLRGDTVQHYSSWGIQRGIIFPGEYSAGFILIRILLFSVRLLAHALNVEKESTTVSQRGLSGILIWHEFQANWKRQSVVFLKLGQRLRRWPSIKRTTGGRLRIKQQKQALLSMWRLSWINNIPDHACIVQDYTNAECFEFSKDKIIIASENTSVGNSSVKMESIWSTDFMGENLIPTQSPAAILWYSLYPKILPFVFLSNW